MSKQYTEKQTVRFALLIGFGGLLIGLMIGRFL